MFPFAIVGCDLLKNSYLCMVNNIGQMEIMRQRAL